MKGITEDRLLKMIRIGIQTAGSQKAFARRVGVSEQYLSDMLLGRRDVGKKVLKWFGLERKVIYYRVDGGNL